MHTGMGLLPVGTFSLLGQDIKRTFRNGRGNVIGQRQQQGVPRFVRCLVVEVEVENLARPYPISIEGVDCIRPGIRRLAVFQCLKEFPRSAELPQSHG